MVTAVFWLGAAVAALMASQAELKTDDGIDDDPFGWIRAIESGPTGQRIMLKAAVYKIDRQYQLPRGTELVGAGTNPAAGRTVIRAVGKNYNDTCGPNGKH